MAAVAAPLCSREIIKNVSHARGFQASFRPKPFQLVGGSGLHLHLSIHRVTTKREHSIPEELKGASDRAGEDRIKASQFLSGILGLLVDLCGFSMPSHESYARASDPSVMGRYVAWGKTISPFLLIKLQTDIGKFDA